MTAVRCFCQRSRGLAAVECAADDLGGQRARDRDAVLKIGGQMTYTEASYGHCSGELSPFDVVEAPRAEGWLSRSWAL